MSTPNPEANFQLLCALESKIADKFQRLGWDSLLEVEKTIYSVWWLIADVNNGGFNQYFFNSWADQWPDALVGLNLISAHQTASIFKSAIEAFPVSPSLIRFTRQAQLLALIESQEAVLELATDRFFDQSEDLESLLAAYARSQAVALESIC